MKINKLSWIIALIVLSSICYAQIEFYQGDAVLEKVDTEIDLSGEVNMIYSMFSSKGEDVLIRPVFGGDEQNVFLDEAGKDIAFSHEPLINEGVLKEFDFNPRIYVDDNVYARTALFYKLKVILPSGVNNLLNPPDGYVLSSENGRVVYTWEAEQVYLTSFKFSWSTSDANIGLVKEANYEGDILNVKLIVQNKGKNVENVVLEEVFFPTKFEPISPLSEFELYSPSGEVEENEEWIWGKSLVLSPGEIKEVEYSVKDLSSDLGAVLNPTTVFVDGILVSTSNQVEVLGKDGLQNAVDKNIEKATEFEAAEEAAEEAFVSVAEDLGDISVEAPQSPTEMTNYIGYAVIVLLFVVLLFIYLRKKK